MRGNQTSCFMEGQLHRGEQDRIEEYSSCYTYVFRARGQSVRHCCGNRYQIWLSLSEFCTNGNRRCCLRPGSEWGCSGSYGQSSLRLLLIQSCSSQKHQERGGKAFCPSDKATRPHFFPSPFSIFNDSACVL